MSFLLSMFWVLLLLFSFGIFVVEVCLLYIVSAAVTCTTNSSCCVSCSELTGVRVFTAPDFVEMFLLVEPCWFVIIYCLSSLVVSGIARPSRVLTGGGGGGCAWIDTLVLHLGCDE